MAQVYAVTSGKGGVGKTTIVANLGTALAKFGKRTLMIDADIAMPNLAILFGLKNTPITLYDLLGKKKVDVKQAIYEARGKAHIIPCGASLEGFLKSNLDLIKKVVEKVREDYDFIIIDAPSGLSQHSIAPLEAADETFLVATPDAMAVSDALKMKTAVELLDLKITRAIINRVRGKSFVEKLRSAPSLGVRRIEMELQTKVVGVIPEDTNITASVHIEKPVVVYKPGCKASQAFKMLAARLIRETMPQPEKPPEIHHEKPAQPKHHKKESW